jgi:hypothetical protein
MASGNSLDIDLSSHKLVFKHSISISEARRRIALKLGVPKERIRLVNLQTHEVLGDSSALALDGEVGAVVLTFDRDSETRRESTLLHACARSNQGATMDNVRGRMELNLDDYDLRELPESFGSLTTLRTLSLRWTGLSNLPESFVQLTQLHFLDIAHNRFKIFPESICQLTRLQTLCVGSILTDSLPESLGQLVALRKFSYDGKLARLPNCFPEFRALEEVIVCDTCLSDLPENFGQLTALRRLNLSRNRLTGLPESFGKLTRLEYLHLRCNTLKSLPESFGQLAALRELDIEGNQISTLPKSFDQLALLLVEMDTSLRLRCYARAFQKYVGKSFQH